MRDENTAQRCTIKHLIIFLIKLIHASIAASSRQSFGLDYVPIYFAGTTMTLYMSLYVSVEPLEHPILLLVVAFGIQDAERTNDQRINELPHLERRVHDTHLI